MTRNDLAYVLIKELNPSEDEVPELFCSAARSFAMKRVYQVRSWPKAKIERAIMKVVRTRMMSDHEVTRQTSLTDDMWLEFHYKWN